MNYKHIISTALALYVPLIALAQTPLEKIDSIRAKVPGTAFDYLLQKRRIAKRFESKTFADRFFIEMSAAPNAVLSGGKPQYSATANVAAGDWLTPEHAWRASVGAGFYKTGEQRTKALHLAGDYLMNITAVGRPEYEKPLPFELMGVAGVDLVLSHKAGEADFGLGAHCGLRGQAALGRAGYIFLEPRFTVMADEAVAMPSSLGVRGVASVAAGLGLRNVAASGFGSSSNGLKESKSEAYATSGHFLDNAFLSLGMGGGAILTSVPSEWHRYTGPTATMSIGKWFSPLHAVRLSATAAAYRQRDEGRAKAAGVRAEYIFNLYNALAGYRREAPFSLNLAGGFSYNASKSSAEGVQSSLGAGLGLQAAFRVAEGVEIFLEPRLDAYGRNYAVKASSTDGYDVASSLQLGLNFRQWLDTREQRARNEDFRHKSRYDHFFIEGAAGGALPVTTSDIRNFDKTTRPLAYVSIGKWHSPTGGVRLWGEAGKLNAESAGGSNKSVAFGAEYLWNATNTFHGYLPGRRFELSTGLGFNFAARNGSKRLYPGLGGSLKVHWNAAPMVGVFVQPMVRAYNDDFLPGKTNFTHLDYTLSLVAGLHLRLSGYNPAAARAIYKEEGPEGSFSIAGGIGAQGTAIAHTSLWGQLGRISYTRGTNPISSWRISLSGYHNRLHGRQYAKAAAEGDYMVNLSNLGLGYNPERIVNLKAFAGIGLGADYNSGKGSFAPSLHGGAQLSARLTPHLRAFIEPRLGYEMSSRYDGNRLSRVQSSAMLGLDYSFKARTSRAKAGPATERPSFVSLALGTGAYTGSLTSMPGLRRKFTFVSDLVAGRWLNNRSGFAVGFSSTAVQRKGDGNQWLSAIHADYLLNLRTALSNVEDTGNPLRLSAAIGANLTFSSKKSEEKTHIAPGLQAALEAGWRFSSGLELFLRPQATLLTKGISGGKGHPAEGELRLMLGTKYCF